MHSFFFWDNNTSAVHLSLMSFFFTWLLNQHWISIIIIICSEDLKERGRSSTIFSTFEFEKDLIQRKQSNLCLFCWPSLFTSFYWFLWKRKGLLLKGHSLSSQLILFSHTLYFITFHEKNDLRAQLLHTSLREKSSMPWLPWLCHDYQEEKRILFNNSTLLSQLMSCFFHLMFQSSQERSM